MFTVKEVGLIIDLDQLPTLSEDHMKRAVNGFYNPFIKFLKSNKNISVTLNISLGTLELLDNFGYKDVISDIRELYVNDRLEISGGTAYYADLSCLPEVIAEPNVILNEYGVGYYLGYRQGFEGEPSIMIRDVEGFMLSSGQLNENSARIISELGYKWVGLRGKVQDYAPILDIQDLDLCAVTYLEDLNSSAFELFSEDDSYDYEKEVKEFSTVLKDTIKKVDSSGVSTLILHLGYTEAFKLSGSEEHRRLLNTVYLTFEELEKQNIKCVSISEASRPTVKRKSMPLESIIKGSENKGQIEKKGEEQNFKNLTNLIQRISVQLRKVTNIDNMSSINMWKLNKSIDKESGSFHLYAHIFILINKIVSLLVIKDVLQQQNALTSTFDINDIVSKLIQGINNYTNSMSDNEIDTAIKRAIADVDREFKVRLS